MSEEIYVRQPDGFADGTNHVCKLKQVMYSLKQCSRQWNSVLNCKLIKFGLTRSEVDPYVYVMWTTFLFDGKVISDI